MHLAVAIFAEGNQICRVDIGLDVIDMMYVQIYLAVLLASAKATAIAIPLPYFPLVIPVPSPRIFL